MLMMYRDDECVKIVEWTGADPLRLMRKVSKDLYDATRHWQAFLRTDSHVILDESETTKVDETLET
jgi:hypothetical protein